MEFHANNWSDLIALRPLLNAALRFFCRKDPILLTAIVATLAKAGMKAEKPLLVLKECEGREVLENFESWSVESVFCPNWSEEFCANDSLDLGTLECIVLLLFFILIPFSTSVRSSFNNCWIARSLFLLCCMALALLSCVASHNALGNVVRVTLDCTGSYVLSQ